MAENAAAAAKTNSMVNTRRKVHRFFFLRGFGLSGERSLLLLPIRMTSFRV